MDFLKYFDDQDLFYLRDHLKGFLEDIYQTGNMEDFEFHLQEIFAYFDMKVPATAPMLMRKPQTTKIDAVLNEWKEYVVEWGKELITK